MVMMVNIREDIMVMMVNIREHIMVMMVNIKEHIKGMVNSVFMANLLGHPSILVKYPYD